MQQPRRYIKMQPCNRELSPQELTCKQAQVVPAQNNRKKQGLDVEKHFSMPHRVFQFYSRLHLKFGLKTHTLFLAHHIHRLLLEREEIREVARYDLVLTVLVMTMKYEEVYHPSLERICEFVGRALPASRFMELEIRILKALSANLIHSTLDRRLEEALICDAGESGREVLLRAYCLAEIVYFNDSAPWDFTLDELKDAIVGIIRNQFLIDLEQEDQSGTVELAQKRILLQLRKHQRSNSVVLQKYEKIRSRLASQQ